MIYDNSFRLKSYISAKGSHNGKSGVVKSFPRAKFYAKIFCIFPNLTHPETPPPPPATRPPPLITVPSLPIGNQWPSSWFLKEFHIVLPKSLKLKKISICISQKKWRIPSSVSCPHPHLRRHLHHRRQHRHHADTNAVPVHIKSVTVILITCFITDDLEELFTKIPQTRIVCNSQKEIKEAFKRLLPTPPHLRKNLHHRQRNRHRWYWYRTYENHPNSARDPDHVFL